MKLYIYCYKDKKIGAYQAPKFDNQDKEHITESVIRSCAYFNDATEAAKARDLSLYYFGIYDDITAKFELVEPEKLVDLEDHIKFEVKDNA